MKISCKSCGANLKFIPSKQIACCEHCGNTYKPEEIEYDDNIFDNYKEYTCSSCGAKLISSEKTGITSCVYCQGKEFVVGKINKDYILTGIIPFRLDKEQFIKNYKEQIEKLDNVKNDFKESLKKAKIQGMYVPYSFANSFYRKQYGEVLFTLLEEIIPYNFEDVKDFNPIYLDGLMADTIAVKKEENFIKTNDSSFYWVPVWVAEIEYKNDIYYIVANGQTWELAGMYKSTVKNFFLTQKQVTFQEKLSSIHARESIKRQKIKEINKNALKNLDTLSSNEVLKIEREKEKERLKYLCMKEEAENAKKKNIYLCLRWLFFILYILALLVFFLSKPEDENIPGFILIATFVYLLLNALFTFHKENEDNTYYEKFLRANNEIKNNEYEEMSRAENSDIIDKILQLPEDKVYENERSIYLFTKKYSWKDKNNSMKS